MNSLQYIFSSEAIEAIGWTIIHSLWQGAIVGVVLSVLLLIISRNSAQLKYLVAFFSLFIVVGWSVVTFVNAYQYAQEKTALKQNITNDPHFIKKYLEQTVVENATVEVTDDQGVNLSVVKIRSYFQRNFNLICSIWVLGMILLIVRLIGGFIYSRRLRSYQILKLDSQWVHKIDEFASKLQLRRKVEAFFSPLVSGPMTLGTIKPIILFPIAAFTGLSTKDVEAIIAHELAHVLRHDYFFNIIQSIVEILYFYHPVVWIISTQIRNERENSCDNIAVELTGDKVAYVRALAQVQINQAESGHLAMAFASPKNNVLHRIKRLQKQVVMKTNFFEGLIAAAVVVIGLILVSFTLGNGVNSQVMPLDDQETIMEEPLTNTTVWTVEKRDSVKRSMEKSIANSKELETVSEEIETMVEVALSENNQEVSTEMMQEINEVLEDLNISEIVQDALWEAKKAIEDIDMEEIMDEAREDIDFDEIERDMEEVKRDIREARKEMREDIRRDMRAEGDVSEEIIELSIEAAEMGLDAAEAVIENLPLEEIIEAALKGVGAAFEAIDEIDFENIMDEVEDAMDEVEDEMDRYEDKREHERDRAEERRREFDRNRSMSEKERKLDQEIREELQEEREALRHQLDIEREEMRKELEKEREAMRMKMEAERKQIEAEKRDLHKQKQISSETNALEGFTEEEAKEFEKEMKAKKKQMEKDARRMEKEAKKMERKAKKELKKTEESGV